MIKFISQKRRLYLKLLTGDETGAVDGRLLRSILAYIVGSGLVALGGLAFQSHIEDALLFTISCVILLISFFLMHRTVGLFHFRHLSIPSFWYFTYLAMIFFPAFFVYYDVEGDGRNRFLLAVHSVLITVPLGMLIVNKIRNFSRSEIHRYLHTPIQESEVSFHHFILIASGGILALGLMTMHIMETNTFPLFYLIQNIGDSYTTALLREDAAKLLDSRFSYLYNILNTFGYPFLIISTIGYYLVTRQAKWFVVAFIIMTSGLFYLSIDTSKGPVATLILQLFLFMFFYRKGKISNKTIGISIALIISFPLMITMLAFDVSLYSALLGISHRLFYTPSYVLYWYFELFPDTQDYLYGRSVGRLAWLLGLDFFHTPNFVAKGMGMTGTASANGSFIGNLNADFGLIGVLCGGVITGILMQTIQVSLMRHKKNIINTAVYAICICAFWKLNSTALPVVLATNGVLFVLLIPFLVKMTVNILQISLKKSSEDKPALDL